MQTARRFIVALSYAAALWVAVSVAGALLDPTHAAFWSLSLMWSFLSTLLVAPALVLIFDASLDRKREEPHAGRTAAPAPASDSEDCSAPRSFVEDAAGAAYPVPDELGEQQTTPKTSRPD
ncbi:MAG: hypothetical protein ABEL97_13595 [Salinibacter sp.]